MLRRQLTLRVLSFLLGGGSAAWGEAALHTLVVYSHPPDRLVKCGQEHLPPKVAGEPQSLQSRPQVSIC